ncbi:MerR family transcriptional regulator [Staphylococcus argenteus]|uniref:MerR family transcriptional regulator n=1 Tax=Staphylococcus argenteus TaxID=985002 RepID=UPI0005088391|nr:MerR family transcriptional regulator [Staphylococcus argenteus]MBE2132986.1 MerR family transcriptional regulator [Staphylococcus argenteus]MBE2147604.1 MerR family transcriptional regulator [Staphylococcus argenteus]MBE2160695.1 MerR family transcriptional regulator [Staphylococcus argenteus]MCG9797905.1 MerR family transcriptional regulator [Staphylococcus argenteus]MCG9799924.1 MerR family transcriptional regulator [Staphylococcus argenteus]
MSNYSTGELAKLCNVTTRTIQYYDRKGILKPEGFTEGNRRVYTEQQRETLELILLLKDLGCALSDIDMLLKGDSTLKTLNAMLELKQQDIDRQIKQQKTMLNKIKNIQHYVNDESKSPISHLKDIDNVMSKSNEMKNIRRKIWISAGMMGVIQYSSIMSAILMKNKWPFLIALPFMIGYGIGVTAYYQGKVAYLCPNCQHVFSPSLWQVVKAPHTATTRRFECPNCHETHYCIEIPKTHMSSEKLHGSKVYPTIK